MKTVIVMTYHNRHDQLNNTLNSFKNYDPKIFSVIIVDDFSDKSIELSVYPFDITKIRIDQRIGVMGDIAWNTGFAKALEQNPDTIIIQNAECYHQGDILGFAEKFIHDENYISFGCYSLGKGDKFEVVNNRHINFDGENAWYNHPVFWPCGLHFCSAITAKNLIKLNGFDERYSDGRAFDDDDFLNRVRKLGLRVMITADPFVFHQWHYSTPPHPNQAELYAKNETLWHKLKQENNYRAQHSLTPDL